MSYISVDITRVGGRLTLLLTTCYDADPTTVCAGADTTTVTEQFVVSVGEAPLGPINLQPNSAAVLLYKFVLQQEVDAAGSGTAVSGSSGTDLFVAAATVRSLAIRVHDGADVGMKRDRSTEVITTRHQELELCNPGNPDKDATEIIQQTVAVRFQGVGLSRDDLIQSASIQFTAVADSGDDLPLITITAELAANSAPLVPVFSPTLPLVPVQKATGSNIKAGGTVMIASSVDSYTVCFLLSTDKQTYAYREGIRINGPPMQKMLELHGEYLFTGAVTAEPVSTMSSRPQVVLKIACEPVGIDANNVNNGATDRFSMMPRTAANVVWKPLEWKAGESGSAEQVVDLAPLLREARCSVVGR
jgi:hypothetical protein